jgi:hypothetical protein
MFWYKEVIQKLIEELELEREEPYDNWNPNLFEDVTAGDIPDSVDARLTNIALTIGTWERVEKTIDMWGSEQQVLSSVYTARLVTEMYLCLVYPRETAMKNLADRLPYDSPEWEICTCFSRRDSDYRHIRNSLAHGRFTIFPESIIFHADDWQEELSLERVRLDCYIVFDIFMSAYSAKIRKS